MFESKRYLECSSGREIQQSGPSCLRLRSRAVRLPDFQIRHSQKFNYPACYKDVSRAESTVQTHSPINRPAALCGTASCCVELSADCWHSAVSAVVVFVPVSGRITSTVVIAAISLIAPEVERLRSVCRSRVITEARQTGVVDGRRTIRRWCTVRESLCLRVMVAAGEASPTRVPTLELSLSCGGNRRDGENSQSCQHSESELHSHDKLLYCTRSIPPRLAVRLRVVHGVHKWIDLSTLSRVSAIDQMIANLGRCAVKAPNQAKREGFSAISAIVMNKLTSHFLIHGYSRITNSCQRTYEASIMRRSGLSSSNEQFSARGAWEYLNA